MLDGNQKELHPPVVAFLHATSWLAGNSYYNWESNAEIFCSGSQARGLQRRLNHSEKQPH